MAKEEKELIKKHMVAVFVNAGDTETPDWVRICKATDFERTMNAVTEERDYIADEHPTTEVTDYKPSEGLTITTYKGEPDFEMMYKLYKKRAIGSAAQKEVMLVYLFDKVVSGGKDVYYADKSSCTITVDSFNTSSSTMTCTVYENGTPITGSVTISPEKKPVFTEGEMPEADTPSAGTGDNT